jgi:lactate dehydrogenase-like 2-hydroxyacid dehydrogenase
MALFETRQIGWIGKDLCLISFCLEYLLTKFITGLGSMGLAMATNIQNALQNQGSSSLKFYNRTASRGQTLQERGAKQCASISDLVQNSDWICISVRYQYQHPVLLVECINNADFLDVDADEQ